MTNLEVIQLFCTKAPELLIELLDDIYCVGWNDGANAVNCQKTGKEPHEMIFDLNWAESEYDGNWFRPSDVVNTLQK